MNDGKPVDKSLVDAELDAKLRQTWLARQAPTHFVDAVMDALTQAHGFEAHHPAASPRRRSRRLIAIAAAMLFALLLLGVWIRIPHPQQGEISRQLAQQSISIGTRAQAVAEPGASLSYAVDWLGDTRVKQPSGTVFYRVAKGAVFIVETPVATVQVTGTCFRVEVMDMQKIESSRRQLPSMLLAGLAGAAVVVGVYEGSVVFASQGEELSLTPGQGAIASATNKPQRFEEQDVTARAALVAAERDALAQQLAELRLSADNQQPNVDTQLAEVLAQKHRLEGELADLKAELDIERNWRTEREGEAVAFPKGLPEAYKEPALLDSFKKIVDEVGNGAEITAVDCSEFPCIVFSEVTVAGDKGAIDATVERYHQAIDRRYASEDNEIRTRTSVFGQKNVEGVVEQKAIQATSIYPKDIVDADTRTQISKRIRTRDAQYLDSLRGN